MSYIPIKDNFGLDEALPLQLLIHRNRKTRCAIGFLPADLKPMTVERRTKLLSAHCSKRGKRHEFVIETRDGQKCLWCGIVRAEEMH
jgi:hypothetical protein